MLRQIVGYKVFMIESQSTCTKEMGSSRIGQGDGKLGKHGCAVLSRVRWDAGPIQLCLAQSLRTGGPRGCDLSQGSSLQLSPPSSSWRQTCPLDTS